jgi:AAHS family 4-hydroxybenzoate transporter-like MFS transporter
MDWANEKRAQSRLNVSAAYKSPSEQAFQQSAEDARMDGLRTTNVTMEVDDVLNGAKVGSFHLFIAVLCAAIMFFDGYSAAVTGYIAPPIAADLHISRAALGPIISANLAGNILGLLFSSLTTHRIGQRRMSMLALAVFGVSEILAALFHSQTGLLVFRFISGTGLASAILCAVALTGEFFPARWRSSAVTYIFLGFTLGEMASGVATRFLMGMGYSWQAPMILGGVAALGLSGLLFLILPDSPEYLINRGNNPKRAREIINRVVAIPADVTLVAQSKVAKRASVAELFAGNQTAVTLLLWFAASMTMMLSAFIHSWLTTMLVDAGMRHADAVSVTVFVTASGIVAGFTVGPLMDKAGPFFGLIGLMVLGAVAATVLAFFTNAALFSAVAFAAFALGYCSSGLGKGWHAMGVFLYPTALRATGLGWLVGIGRTGSVIGPIAVGFLVQAGIGPAAIFQMIAVPLLLASGAAFTAFRLRARNGQQMPDALALQGDTR